MNVIEWPKDALRLDLLMLYPSPKHRDLHLLIEEDVWKSVNPSEREGVRELRRKAMSKHLKRGLINEGTKAGLVLQCAIEHWRKKGKPPTKGQAYRRAAAIWREVRPSSRGGTPDVENPFKVYGRYAHFWAAREKLISSQVLPAYIPFAPPNVHWEYTLEGWRKFLGFAEILHVLGTEMGFLRKASYWVINSSK